MSLDYQKENIEHAKQLRTDMTKQERHLWYDFLKTYPVRFQRQKCIDTYIADFYCHVAKLVIELDGGQHYEEDALAYDKARTERLESLGIQVLRLTNLEIDRQFHACCEYIDRVVKERVARKEGT